jgi:hypothetical protein
MPPKAAAKPADATKMFSAEVVATILAISGVTIGNKHYNIMAKLDETKTASGWDHHFRSVKGRAKEISEMIANGVFGDIGAAAAPKPKTPAGSTKKSGGGKRGMSTSLHG